MANSRFAHVRSFELPDPLLPSTYLVCRIDGRSFHRFSDVHGFEKPNDERALRLMDEAAKGLMEEVKDVVLAFGESDEFSFLLRKDCSLYNRRHSKILSALVSIFTSQYVFHWPTYFPSCPLQYPPSFDARIIVYPGVREIRDYFAWRQADTHINNLYNTAFWALVQKGGLSTTAAHAQLKGTISSQKHEILHQRFGINYNNLPERYRKGSVLVRKPPDMQDTEAPAVHAQAASPSQRPVTSDKSDSDPVIPDHHPAPGISAEIQDTSLQPNTSHQGGPKSEKKDRRDERRRRQPEWDGTSGPIELLHCDVIKDDFWDTRPWLLK